MANVVTDDLHPDLGGNLYGGDDACFIRNLWDYLIDRYAIRSVLDIGCGEGYSVSYFHRRGLFAHGIDGLPQNVERAVCPIALHDLTVRPYLMPVDLVNCIEVVEHIEEKFLENLLETLANGRIICMTHAIPGQDGYHYVNCQPAEYWIAHLERHGYLLAEENDVFRKIAAAENGFKYFAEAGLVFVRRVAHPWRATFQKSPQATIESAVAPAGREDTSARESAIVWSGSGPNKVEDMSISRGSGSFDRGFRDMATAVVTFVYNEAEMLPIWLRYYAGIFGERNLFIIDHSSSDGSTDDLGKINKLLFPREELDEHKRCVFMASFVKGLLEYFDTVIYTDCDELLVPDLGAYADLKGYIEKNDFDYIGGVGLNLTQITSLEPPLDLTQPILRQRRFARFGSGVCKPLITRIPLIWGTGFHGCNQPIRIDPSLFMLHLKAMDYGMALRKQKQTREMKWSASSIAAGHGAHARYDDEQLVRELFLDPNNLVTSPHHGVGPFEFSQEIEKIKTEAVCCEGIFVSPFFNGNVVELPERLRAAF